MRYKLNITRLCVLIYFLFVSATFVHAQKIRTIKHKKRQYPVKTVELDTAGVTVKIIRLGADDLYYYSVISYNSLPEDISVFINPGILSNRKGTNEKLFILYRLNNSDYQSLLSQDNFAHIMYHLNYHNPFLQGNGLEKYHVFLLKITNNRLENLYIDPDLIEAVTPMNKKLNAISRNDFSVYSQTVSDIDSKIIDDNLFRTTVLFPSESVRGLLCFPIQFPGEKLKQIIIPNLQIESEQYMKLVFDF